jgi:hypothetical protein
LEPGRRIRRRMRTGPTGERAEEEEEEGIYSYSTIL